MVWDRDNNIFDKIISKEQILFAKDRGLKVGEELLSNLDIDYIFPENLLFQSGYLTIKELILWSIHSGKRDCEGKPSSMAFFILARNWPLHVRGLSLVLGSHCAATYSQSLLTTW